MRQQLGFRACVLLMLMSACAARAEVYLPPELEAWQPWVLHGIEWINCPRYHAGDHDEASGHRCVWAGPLQLDLDSESGSFEVSLTAYRRSEVQLPGDLSAWPMDVRDGSRSVPVLENDGMPIVFLDPGEHVIRGRLGWDVRPDRLAIPGVYGLLAVRLDGKRITTPTLRDGRLWLAQSQLAEREEEALSIKAGRRIIDEVPTLLETVLELSVSGSPREITIPALLLPGLTPVLLTQPEAGDQAIPIRLRQDGSAIAQVRSGEYVVRLVARASGVLDSLTAPAELAADGGQEIWVFDSQPRHRVAVATGARQVDLEQTPFSWGSAYWRQLPAYLLSPGETLVFDERSRGLSPDERNRLQIYRTLWLDFSGEGFHVEDQISGQMRRGWRLDLRPPLRLESALDYSREENLLITEGKDAGLRGIELRSPDPEVVTHSRLQRSGALPVHGWSEPVESMSGMLVLPPGWRLYGAPGADRAVGSWWDRWTLLDMFLLLITTVFLFRLLGPVPAAVGAVFMALNFHEAGGLFVPLLGTVLLMLGTRELPQGRMRTVSAVLRDLFIIALAVAVIPFTSQQATLALFPQLQAPGIQAQAPETPFSRYRPMEERFQQEAMAKPEPRALSPEGDTEEVQIDRVQVTGARIRPYDLIQRIPENAVVQSGPGRPAWSWTRHPLSWSGPVAGEQQFRLVLSPPWLTSCLRWLSILLLALLLYYLARQLAFRPAGTSRPDKAALLFASILVLGVYAGPVTGDTPDAGTLNELKRRLMEGPECGENCATLASARLAVEPDRLTIQLEWHVESPVAVSLPREKAYLWAPGSVVVDGRPVDRLTGLEAPLALLGEGVHVMVLEGPLGATDGLELEFPLRPHFVTADASGWDLTGIARGRLAGSSVKLARQAAAEVRGSDVSRDAQVRMPPFAVVKRRFMLDREWTVSTVVSRWNDEQGSMSVQVPLLNGEQVYSQDVQPEDGFITAHLSDDRRLANWHSRLEPRERLEISAPQQTEYQEAWTFIVSPTWHVEFEGMPQVLPESMEEFWVYSFLPRPGETLALSTRRPVAADGSALAVDSVTVRETIGQQQRSVFLSARLRTTLGQEHKIQLPDDASIRHVALDGVTHYLRALQGELAVPLGVGEQLLELELTRPAGVAAKIDATGMDLGAETANLKREIKVPENRWILAAWGPGVGPAILYWAVLAVMIILAFLLARIPWSPLRFYQWVLLGIGFSLFQWQVFVLVAAWLLGVGFADRSKPPKGDNLYNLRQLLLITVSVLAVLTVVGAIPGSLLSQPDMQIRGMGSAGWQLVWFLDRSDGAVPVQHVFSLPMWTYKLAILLWALWLSLMLVKWVRWTWECLNRNEFWRGGPIRKAKS